MKRICFFLRRWKKEIFTTITTLIMQVVNYVIALVRYDNMTIFVLLSFLFVFASLLLIMYFISKEKGFYYIPLTNRKEKDDWIGRGAFEFERIERCFSITNADPGYIFSKCLVWNDYELKLKFRIIKDCLGVILRAINLSNHIMLQIGINGIRPHIRINGGWKAWEIEETSLSFSNKLSLDTWYKVCILCMKDSISIKLFDDKTEIFNRQWAVPQGIAKIEFKDEESKTKSKPIKIPLSINLEYGSFGFRNWGEEKAFIKDVLIERI